MKSIRTVVLLATLAFIPAAAHAQTITACYVPKSGSVYRIKVEGAPGKCSQNHVEFSWQAGATSQVGYAVRTGQVKTIQPLSSDIVSVLCLAGEKAVGGGYHINQGLLVSTRINRPLDDGTGWVVNIVNPGDIEYAVTPYVVCLALPL